MSKQPIIHYGLTPSSIGSKPWGSKNARKTRFLSVFIAIMLAYPANAVATTDTPAQQLFNQAFYYLSLYYYGYTTILPDNFVKPYQEELNQSCKKQPNCAYSFARPIIDKMVSSLNDGHTAFISQEYVNLVKDEPEDLVIGVLLDQLDDSLLIKAVVVGSPAEKIGLRRGDVIFSVDNQSINGTNLLALLQKSVRSGKNVRLFVRRNDKEFTVQLKGAKIDAKKTDLPSLYTVSEGVGVLKIPTFYLEGVGQEVHKLIKRANSAKLNYLILDLRDNSGGFPGESIISAGAFVQKVGLKIKFQGGEYNLSWENNKYIDKTGNQIQESLVIDGSFWNKPAAVLINDGSASAAEVFTYFLQNMKRIPVFGNESFGIANTAREEYNLLDGSQLIITTARSFNLDEKQLPAKITPNFAVQDDLSLLNVGKDLILDKAIAFLKKK